MYPEDLIAPMRAELTNAGFEEFRDAEEMKARFTAKAPP